MKKNRGCKFCDIIRGEEKTCFVFEDEVSVAFLDHRPLFPGHTLLLTKEHYQTIIDLPGELVQPFFRNAQILTQAIEEGLDAEGTFLAINNRISQSIPHLHIHIVPRRKHDGLKGFFWPRHSYKSEKEMKEIEETIRFALRRLQSICKKQN